MQISMSPNIILIPDSSNEEGKYFYPKSQKFGGIVW